MGSLKHTALGALLAGTVLAAPALAQSTLEVAIIGEPQSLDPMLSTQDVVSIVTQHFIETLYTFDSGWNVVPLLATELPAISEDGTTYTIALRDGITFHDGSTMDSADVVASLKRWTEQATRGRSVAGQIESITAPDPLTVEIKLKAPYAPLLSLLAFSNSAAAVYPEEVLGEQLSAIVGTGPYKLVEHKPDQYIQVARFDGYVSRDEPSDGNGGALKVGQIIAEGLVAHNVGTPSERKARVAALLGEVGLAADAANRYPHEFSGGQRQRIGIARALALDPEFIVADESVSALDVSIQAQILNLLLDLRESRNLTMLFIAHDLSVVEYLCDQIVVMYLGRIVEQGSARQLYHAPAHPYTRALLSAIPQPDPRAPRNREVLVDDIPSPLDPPSGCVFRTRCRLADAACAATVPPPVSVAPGQISYCLKSRTMTA